MAGRPVGSHVETGWTNAPKVIRTAMKKRGYTLKMLAEELGYRGPRSAWGMLDARRNMQVNVLVSMLDVLGFDVIVKDRNTANRENVWKLERVYEKPESGVMKGE